MARVVGASILEFSRRRNTRIVCKVSVYQSVVKVVESMKSGRYRLREMGVKAYLYGRAA